MLGCHASAKGFRLLRASSLEDSLGTVLLSAIPSPGLDNKDVICSAMSSSRAELSVAKSSVENHGFLSLQLLSPLSDPILPLPGPLDRCNASRGHGARVGAGGVVEDEEIVMRLLGLTAEEYHQTNRIFIPRPADDRPNSHDSREIARTIPRIVEPIGDHIAHDKAQGDGLYVWIGQAGIVQTYNTITKGFVDGSMGDDLINYFMVWAIAAVFELKSKSHVPFFDFKPVFLKSVPKFQIRIGELLSFLGLSTLEIDFESGPGPLITRLRAKGANQEAGSSLPQDDSSSVDQDMASLLDYMYSAGCWDKDYRANYTDLELFIHNGLWKVLVNHCHTNKLPIESSKTNPSTAEAIVYNLLIRSSVSQSIFACLKNLLGGGFGGLGSSYLRGRSNGLGFCCAVIVLNEIIRRRDDLLLFADMRACIKKWPIVYLC